MEWRGCVPGGALSWHLHLSASPHPPMLPVPSFQGGENRNCLPLPESFHRKYYFQTSQLLRGAQAAQSSPCFSCHGSQVGFTSPSILFISLIPSALTEATLCHSPCQPQTQRTGDTPESSLAGRSLEETGNETAHAHTCTYSDSWA